MSVAVLAALHCGPVLAQGLAAVADGALPTVVVTAARTPTRIDQTLAHVTVISRAEIERATGSTLAGLLATQPDVQFSSNGGIGKTSTVFLRGLEARHTLLLVDGVRLSSATVGIPSFDNIPLEDIERIEIVRGPLAGLYGSDAVGGVIQVFTRQGRLGLRGNASLTLGSNDHQQLVGGLQLGQGNLSAAVQVQHARSRGFSSTNPRALFGGYDPDRDGFSQDAVSARAGLQMGAGWRADARLLESHLDTQYDELPGTDSLARLHSQVLAVDLGGPVSSRWRTKLSLSRSTDGYDTLRTAFGAGNLGLIETVQRQLSWENSLDTPVGTALLLAERLEQSVSRPGQPFALADRSINALAMGLNGQAGAHTWQANLRQDRNSQFGRQTNGSLGYGYDLTPSWRAAGSLGTSFTAPSFNQLYYPGFGNPLLQPEEGKHAEVSLRWAVPGQQLRATWFDNRLRGYITAGPAPVNVPRTRIDGLSLAYEARRGDWTWSASADQLDPRNTTAGSANQGRQLPRRSKSSVKLGAETTVGAWTLGSRLSAYSARYEDAANTLRMGGYGTVDLRADWRLAPEWALGLSLNNLGDKAHETAYGYNQPGREAYLTLRYTGR